MASNREIVGWFTRGGKRVPIFKGEGKSDPKAKKERSETYQLAGRRKDMSEKTREDNKKINRVLERRGQVGNKDAEKRQRELLRERERDYNPNGTPKGEYGKISDYYERKHASERARKERKSKDRRTMSRVYQDLNDKNTKGQVRRGEGKLTPYYYDSKLGQYHTGEKFNSDAVKADIKEQTRSKTTEHTTTRKARVRSARRKKDGR